MTSVQSNTFNIVITDTSALPSWLAGKSVNEWVAIPNSQLTDYANFSDAYIVGLGMPLPSTHSNTMTWGPNKYGANADNGRTGESWAVGGGHTTYSGMMFDDQLSRVIVGGGDSQWAENSMHAFEYAHDTPVWVQNIIASCHKDYFKTPSTHPSTYPTPTGGDDTRFFRMYDGSRRGGHSYWAPQFLRARNWLTFFGQQQAWPVDFGFDPEVHVGDLDTALWLATNPIADRPAFANDEDAWMQKHPLTEDIYFWGSGGILRKWDESSNAYSSVLDLFSTHDGARLTGSIDWTNNYILFASGGLGGYTHTNFLVDLSSPSKVDVTVVGPYASEYIVYRNGGLWWCPDQGHHRFYKDDGFVYSVTRTGSAEVTVDRVSMTGTGPVDQASQNNKAGGILNNMQYDFNLNGMVLRLGDALPIYFMRTA
ncbi:MAG TPA: hypothetical protein VK663_01355 [Burkholderiales bacterium]|nr:hypothetical protein [Burkholderiales bacterium]